MAYIVYINIYTESINGALFLLHLRTVLPIQKVTLIIVMILRLYIKIKKLTNSQYNTIMAYINIIILITQYCDIIVKNVTALLTIILNNILYITIL